MCGPRAEGSSLLRRVPFDVPVINHITQVFLDTPQDFWWETDADVTGVAAGPWSVFQIRSAGIWCMPTGLVAVGDTYVIFHYATATDPADVFAMEANSVFQFANGGSLEAITGGVS